MAEFCRCGRTTISWPSTMCSSCEREEQQNELATLRRLVVRLENELQDVQGKVIPAQKTIEILSKRVSELTDEKISNEFNTFLGGLTKAWVKSLSPLKDIDIQDRSAEAAALRVIKDLSEIISKHTENDK